jgi:hypothetical protein
MRTEVLIPVFVEQIPKEIEEGKLYITKEFNTSVHLCACGCGGKTVLPFNCIIEGKVKGWDMIEHRDGTVSFTPSIGNWANEHPYHAHYFITKSKIVWV